MNTCIVLLLQMLFDLPVIWLLPISLLFIRMWTPSWMIAFSFALDFEAFFLQALETWEGQRVSTTFVDLVHHCNTITWWHFHSLLCGFCLFQTLGDQIHHIPWFSHLLTTWRFYYGCFECFLGCSSCNATKLSIIPLQPFWVRGREQWASALSIQQ